MPGPRAPRLLAHCGNQSTRWKALFKTPAIVRATKPTTSNKAVASTGSGSCCGVTACCTPAEPADDPSGTVAEANRAAGCNCGRQQAGSTPLLRVASSSP
ncbi:hypothetical protein [Streptomyces sp. NPDC055189]